MSKASPASVFNFGGASSGIIIPHVAWPFSYGCVICTVSVASGASTVDCCRRPSEPACARFLDARWVGRYQCCVWFRLERYPPRDDKAHLFTFLSHQHHGIDIYLTSEVRHEYARLTVA